METGRVENTRYTGWRTDRYKRHLPDLDSSKELKSESMIRANPKAQSAADRLEMMLHSANLNKNLVEAYMEEMAIRRDALNKGELQGAKIEDYLREKTNVSISQSEQKQVTRMLTLEETGESRFVLLNDKPVERYQRKENKKRAAIETQSRQSNLAKSKARSPSPPPRPVFFTESPEKLVVCEREDNREGRWEPISYTAMGDLGFNFRVAPGQGELWGKTSKMWKPM